MQRATSMFGALALLTATATVAGAVNDETGIVTYIHPASNIVEFNDGRTVYLEPGATFTVDGREVTIEQIRPGMRVTVNGGRGTQGQAQPGSAYGTPRASATHGGIDASGTVAKFDEQNRVITFQDGRMVKLGPQSSVWQPRPQAALAAGTQVFVRNGQPAGYRTAWDAAAMPRHRMGTVVSVDPATAVIILNDGTVVRISQATRVQAEGRAIRLSDLRPGDEVVIMGTPQAGTTSGDSGGMAMPGGRSQDEPTGSLPSFFTATFDASEIHLMRKPQAP